MTNNSLDTLFLVGTGAEVGAWPPITAAILDVSPKAPIESGSAEHANFFMAELIAINRVISAKQQASPNPGPTPIPDRIRLLRERIAVRLKQAQSDGSIYLRPFFESTLQSTEWGNSTHVLTTNWDTLIESRFPKLRVVHVHGCVEMPEGLYLPSDYAFDPAHSNGTKIEMWNAMGDAIHQLWAARTVCIYGLGLDPLDNELAAVIHTGLGESNTVTEKVVIFNVEKERKRVMDRLRLLLYLRQDMPQIEFRAVPES